MNNIWHEKMKNGKFGPKFTPNFIFIKKILYKVHTFQNQSLFLIKNYIYKNLF